MLETLDTIFKVAQGVTVVITLLMICVKPFRTWILNLQDRKRADEKQDENRDEALRCSLRNIITQFYYSRRHECELHQYEYENIEKAYNAYKKMGGNSFVDRLWEEIQEWTIVP
jgi:hypothetical protein